MDINTLKRANLIIKNLIPDIDELINMSPKVITILANSIYELSKCDKEFNNKFNQLLLETKQRLQKEFDEI